MTTQIKTGEYLCTVVCPNCDRHVEVPCVLEQVLKVKGADGSLTVALAAKAVPHNCDQEELPFEDITMSVGVVDTRTGEIHEAMRGVRL